jgi:hypothetical protein
MLEMMPILMLEELILLLDLAMQVSHTVTEELPDTIREHQHNLSHKKLHHLKMVMLKKLDGSNVVAAHALREMESEMLLHLEPTLEEVELLFKETKTQELLPQFRELAQRMHHSVTREHLDILKELTYHQKICQHNHSFKQNFNSTQKTTSFQKLLELIAQIPSP